MNLLEENSIVCMGNPMLYMSAKVKPDLLLKHNLKENDSIMTEGEEIFSDLLREYKDRLEYTPGGSTLNTTRVLQWILGKPNVTAFMGCVGRPNLNHQKPNLLRSSCELLSNRFSWKLLWGCHNNHALRVLLSIISQSQTYTLGSCQSQKTNICLLCVYLGDDERGAILEETALQFSINIRY